MTQRTFKLHDDTAIKLVPRRKLLHGRSPGKF